MNKKLTTILFSMITAVAALGVSTAQAVSVSTIKSISLLSTTTALGEVLHLAPVSQRRNRTKSRKKVLRHRVRRGESVGSIARKYRISRTQLIRRNRLRRPYRLRIGQSLYIKRVRVKVKRRVVLRSGKSRSRSKKRGVRKVIKTVRVRTYRHRVRRGETVRSIARGYRVSQRQIIRLNHLHRPYRVRRGKVLIIKRVKTIKYRRVSVAAVSRQKTRRTNKKTRVRQSRKTIKSGLTPRDRKKKTVKIIVKKRQKKVQPIRIRTYTHRVRRGDNLRRLSKRYAVSQGQIIRLNRLRHPYRLRPGRRLIIKKVMIRPGHDEFKLGKQSDWKEIRTGKAESGKIASRGKNTHKNNVKIRKPSTIKGNRLNHLKNRREASKGTGSRHTKGHNATTGTSHRSVINRRVEQVDEKNGFMRGIGRWIWPANGKLDSRFSRSSKGIKISGRLGQGIYAAAKGKIVYIGDSLIRYGNLVIIKHNKIFFTAYAHNQRLLVREGQFVKRGQKIAEMGSASSGKIVLHFEIRKDGRPVDPLYYLPRK